MAEGENAEKSFKQVLLDIFPEAVNIKRATREEDLKGTDYWVGFMNRSSISVDVKVRGVDPIEKYGKDDLILETYSKVEEKKIGWTRDTNKRTDYILWFWKPTGRWLLVPFPMLCFVFRKKWEGWRERFTPPLLQKTETETGKVWHSECILVPRKLVWEEIFQFYGGGVNR